MKDKFIYFPMFMNLERKNVVIIGGGQTAFNRILTLLKTGANVKVVSSWFCKEIKSIQNERLTIVKKLYDKEDLKDAFIVLALTDDKAVNMDIFVDCKLAGILVNVLGDEENSDFIFPAVVSKNGCYVGIYGERKNLKFVKKISDKIRNILRNV